MWLVFAVGSVIAWSFALVMDSILVKNYEKDPFVLMWVQSCVSIVFLSIAAFFVPFETAWLPWLILTSLIAYCGDIILFAAMDRMDASVINITWAFLAIFLSAVGFIFFGEVGFLSYWHHHVTYFALFLLVAIAALFTPSNAVVKAALDSGEVLITVVFWQLCAREVFSFVFPWTMPSFRRRIKALPAKVDALFYWIAFLVIVAYFLGMYLMAEAFKSGSISLVSVVGNIQPFVVLFMAWCVWKLFPRYAAKELLDGQSVFVKLTCFSIVFSGLALLAFS